MLVGCLCMKPLNDSSVINYILQVLAAFQVDSKAVSSFGTLSHFWIQNHECLENLPSSYYISGVILLINHLVREAVGCRVEFRVVVATTSAPQSQSTPSLLDKLWRFNPTTGKIPLPVRPCRKPSLYHSVLWMAMIETLGTQIMCNFWINVFAFPFFFVWRMKVPFWRTLPERTPVSWLAQVFETHLEFGWRWELSGCEKRHQCELTWNKAVKFYSSQRQDILLL